MSVGRKATETISHYRTTFGAVRGKPGSYQSVGATLYWLEGTPLTLYSLNTEDPTAQPTKVFDVIERKGSMSREEELARERMRATLSGVSGYKIVHDGKRIFFNSNGQWYIYAADLKATAPMFVNEAPKIEGVKTDIHFAPHDPYMVSYVVKGNIFVAKLIESIGADGTSFTVNVTTEQLTTIGEELTQCGTADYIMQEEFDRYTGHWWSPDGSQILFTQTDTNPLPQVSIMDSATSTYKMPFPKVGDPNAFTAIAAVSVKDKTFKYLPQVESFFEHSVEYVPRLGWVGGAGQSLSVYVMGLTRRQEDATFVEIPFDTAFVSCQETELDEFTKTRKVPTAASGTGKDTVRSLRRLSIPWAWVDVSSCFNFGASEDLIFGQHAVDTLEEDPSVKDGNFYHLYSSQDRGQSWKALTCGAWNVVNGAVKYFEGNKTISFLANKADRLGRELYLLRRSGTEEPQLQLVSDPNFYVHDYHFLCDPVTKAPKRVFIVHSSPSQPPTSVLVDVAANPAQTSKVQRAVPFLSQITHDDIKEKNIYLADSFVSVVSPKPGVGGSADAAVFFPDAKEFPGVRPLMIYVYGGPHVQLVNKSFDTNCNPVLNAFLKLGVAVAMVDNTMNHGNGLRAHSACKLRMGQFETDDYVLLVKTLTTERFPDRLDAARVGIFGWSYGGYATLLAMSQAPDVFKMGFAGAPVGDWRLYDTGYTERYMGVLPDDEKAYEDGTIAKFAAGFPEELNRVFIGHGLCDENVHFSHTACIIDALVAECKPYLLHAYPGERHGLRQRPASRVHYDTQLINTVLQYL